MIFLDLNNLIKKHVYVANTLGVDLNTKSVFECSTLGVSEDFNVALSACEKQRDIYVDEISSITGKQLRPNDYRENYSNSTYHFSYKDNDSIYVIRLDKVALK